ncbi:hypothetical protein JHK86_009852 [Glycine max]|nr:hypothetical protein JHK86_009852 [Glycine max]
MVAFEEFLVRNFGDVEEFFLEKWMGIIFPTSKSFGVKKHIQFKVRVIVIHMGWLVSMHIL